MQSLYCVVRFHGAIHSLHAERKEAAVQGVEEAKQNMIEMTKKRAEKARTQSGKKDVSAENLARFFRAASPRSVKLGKARLTIEDAVRRAERILLDKKLVQMAASASMEEKAEILAQEIFHTTGSLLTKQDLAHIHQAVPECKDERKEFDCESSQFAFALRTPDGTCNNLDKPTRGASFTAFQRLLPAHYEDGLAQLHGFRQSKLEENIFRDGPFTPPYPSARLVSSNIIRDRMDNASQLTHLVMQWGQFIDHDLDLNVENPPELAGCDFENCVCTDVCAPVQVPEDDDDFGLGTSREGQCLPFTRTIPACQTDDFQARVPLNELTHYLDGSMIYGSTEVRAEFLREFYNGHLKEGAAFPAGSGKPSLPEISEYPPCPPTRDEPSEDTTGRCCPEGFDSCFVAGDVRVNEQVSLTVMHTIWVREHNRVAAALAALNPQWDDDRLYHEARRIVIAQVEQITFEEFLRVLFGENFYELLIGPYNGYQTQRDSTVPNSFATAAFRFGHSLVQNQFLRAGPDFAPNEYGPLPLVEAFMNPQAYFDSDGTDPILRGWVTQPARALDEFLTDVLTTQLFETDSGPGMDLATLNIQRGRDHGLPPYPVWKTFCQNRFKDILPEELFHFSNEMTKIRFLQTYGALDTLDLWVGGLAEEPLPGAVLGPTFACIFAITFSDLRDGDRFWYENTDSDVAFTEDQLAEIYKTSMARVLCDNGDDISTIQMNPFLMGNRVSCLFQIPGINFQPWQEVEHCYRRVRFEPHTERLELSFMSIVAGETRNYPLSLEPNADQVEVCIPFTCPTSLTNTSIAAFPSIINGNLSNFLNCRVSSNAGLPANMAPPGAESVYHASFGLSDVQAINGLFQGLQACESSSTIALTYDCRSSKTQSTSASKSDVELENELVGILQARGKNRASKNRASKKQKNATFLPMYNIKAHIKKIPLPVQEFIKGLGNVQSKVCLLIQLFK